MGAIGVKTNNTMTNVPSFADNATDFNLEKKLFHASQVDEVTKDLTPAQFLGGDNIIQLWNGTGDGLRRLAEEYMPSTLQIGGYTFENVHGDTFRPSLDYEGKNYNKTVVKLEYQSTERIGGIYPIIQVGIRVWRTKGGKVKSEIIRDGYTNKTKFI